MFLFSELKYANADAANESPKHLYISRGNNGRNEESKLTFRGWDWLKVWGVTRQRRLFSRAMQIPADVLAKIFLFVTSCPTNKIINELD